MHVFQLPFGLPSWICKKNNLILLSFYCVLDGCSLSNIQNNVMCEFWLVVWIFKVAQRIIRIQLQSKCFDVSSFRTCQIGWVWFQFQNNFGWLWRSDIIHKYGLKHGNLFNVLIKIYCYIYCIFRSVDFMLMKLPFPLKAKQKSVYWTKIMFKSTKIFRYGFCYVRYFLSYRINTVYVQIIFNYVFNILVQGCRHLLTKVWTKTPYPKGTIIYLL